jgi:glutamate--cysteine ligase
MVPHHTTALTGPLLELEAHLLARQPAIEQWFRASWQETPAPFYCSVDLRNAGFKVAPVDTNLFPAGFNNLNPAFRPLSVQAIQTAVERVCPVARGAVLVPENHTRNVHYFESLASFIDMLALAGIKVRIGSMLPDLKEPRDIALPSGRSVRLEPLVRAGNKVGVDGFEPCMVLLNNDMSAGRPPILEGLTQPVVPPLALGWSQRRKSRHFAHYQSVAAEFATLIDIDPWFIDPLFRKCGEINFQTRDGEECLAANVEAILKSVGEKYKQYGVDKPPFAIVKADAGTYGMAIMTAKSPDDVRELNRKQRTRMAHIKEGQDVTDVLVQEGVYTFETWQATDAVAEPVVYMIDHYVIGGFYRVHTQRGPDENLNSPGMHFQPLAFVEPCSYPDPDRQPDAPPNRFYAYGVIARLALLAAAREWKEAGAVARAAA